MSHNQVKVNSQEPARTGAVSQAVTDLRDVNASSPSTGDILKYSGSEYVASALNNAQYMLIGQGESDNYSNSGATSLAVNDEFYLYDTTPINAITGASITKIGTTDWVESFTLPAGTYTIISNARVVFSASGEFQWRLYSNTATAYRSGRAAIGESLSSYSYFSSLISTFKITQTETLVFRIIAVSSVDSVANQTTTPSQYSSIFIEKVD